jgi:hypothetical protein
LKRQHYIQEEHYRLLFAILLLYKKTFSDKQQQKEDGDEVDANSTKAEKCLC